MYPAYRHTDSYPYFANPTHYTPYDNPRAKEANPHTPNSPYQPWPCGGSHCYPGPPEYHPYCNHNYCGSPYAFWPPYPHYPPPPPPFYAAYPQFPGAYAVPPPHYSIEQPRYDYDKTTITPHHCCGCTHREEEKKPRIERVEPEIEKKTSGSIAPKDYQYPIMWIPPSYLKKTEPGEMEREKHLHDPIWPKPVEKQDENGEAARDLRLPFPIMWLPSKVGKEAKENDDENRNESEPEMIKTPSSPKVIPVKQVETEEEKKNLKREELKVKKTDDRAEGKPASKASKLPPVCLRIDPLPRRKNGSRSPSPPTKRAKPESEDLKKKSETESNKDDPCGKIEREIEGEKAEKKKFSENEAALIVQAVYRGFEVRKSQPLTKLRQIAEVRKQCVELRNRIQDVESDKQKLVIGETIMGLLLKLDTIQGLHPSVRDVRKSVAKELVSLHEKLDSMTFVKPEASCENLYPNMEKDAICEGESMEINNDQLPMSVEADRCVEAPPAASVAAEPEAELPTEQMLVEPERCVEALPAALVEVEHDVNTKEADEVAEPEMELPPPAASMVVEHDVNTKAADEVAGPEMELPPPAASMEVEPDVNTKAVDEVVGPEMELPPPAASMVVEPHVNTKEADEVAEPEMELPPPAASMVVAPNVNTKEADEVAELEIELSPSAASTVVEPDVNTKEADEVAEPEMELPPPAVSMAVEQGYNTKEAVEVAEPEVEMLAPAALMVVEQGYNTKEAVEVAGPKVELLAPAASTVVEESHTSLPIECEKVNGDGNRTAVSGGDGKVVEENERLRAAVEELMKAGKEQLGVITQLTGRVKDLERKLSKRKKKKMRKGSRGRGGGVEDDCVV